MFKNWKELENSKKRKMEYQRLGDYIREVNVRNRDLKVTKLVGLTIDKAFIPSVATTWDPPNWRKPKASESPSSPKTSSWPCCKLMHIHFLFPKLLLECG